MKTWWNILIWMWIGLVHRAEHVNGDFVLTSSPLIPTDGELFTLTCSIRDESIVNIGWLQNNKPKVTTQKTPNCTKQQLAYGQDIINRINVSCSTTAHSMTFRFNSTTDQGAAWQCGKQISDYDIHPRSNNYTIDVASSVMSTQSSSTTTRSVVVTSYTETVTSTKDVASSVMSTQSLSTTTRSTDRTSPPETVTPKKDVATSVMSTRSLSTTTRSMDITSYFETVTPDVASSAISTQSLSTATQSLATTSNPETMTPKKDVSSSAMSTQSPPTATQSLATTSNPETVTPAKDDSNSDTLYIVVGVVAGVVLLILVVVVIGCILWRRKTAHQRYDLKEGINVKSTPFSQNTSSNTVENDLYERSPDVPPINAASNQEEDFILSDAYASDDMAMENTCTPQEQVSSGDVDLENMYAKPDKGQPSNVEHDVYTEVQKPKKNIQDPSVSGTDITGDVYATSNKGRNAHL